MGWGWGVGVGIQFGSTVDPEFPEQLLLEQYAAQLLSTLRAAFDPTAGPLLIIAGAKLAALVVTSGVSGGDSVVVRRILKLITKPLVGWEGLSEPSYAEWVGCKGRVELLTAHASIKCFALGARGGRVAESLLPLVGQSEALLTRCWVGLLRDFAVIRSQPMVVQALYRPFLLTGPSPAGSAMVRPYLDQVWAVVLEALVRGAKPKEGKEEGKGGGGGGGLEAWEFEQLWALSLLVLCEKEQAEVPDGASTVGSFAWGAEREVADDSVRMSTEEEQVAALRALHCLTAVSFCQAGWIPTHLCTELMQVGGA